MGKLKIGFAGCGSIAEKKHMTALTKMTGKCEMTAFCDIVPERAEAAKRRFGAVGARAYTDYRQMLADKNVDVVYILTPNVTHRPIAVAAFEEGKHVMCEKPMAHTCGDAKAIMDAWRQSGKKFTVGYQNRFRPEVQMLHRCCKQGELGEIYFAKAHAVRRRAVPTWGVFTNKALQGGGPLIDIGTHSLDLAMWMMDNYSPVSVTGSVFYRLGRLPQAVGGNMFGPWDPETYEMEDSAFALIKFANGASIQLEAAWAINMRDSREASVTLCGTNAGAELLSGMSYPENRVIFNRGRGGMLTNETICSAACLGNGAEEDPGAVEVRQWIDAILYDTEPLVRPEEAFTVTRVLDAVYQSSETGREIRLD